MTDGLTTCVCGDEFLPSYRGQEHCSAACRKSAKKKPPRSYSRPPGFEDPQRTCRVGSCTARAVHQHHVISRQHLDLEGADVADSRNALSLCEAHHERHTKASRRIKVTELRAENIEFLIETYGSREAAVEYLARYYDVLP